jgi:hypothetical protein
MHRQRISEKNFWSYCCADEGIAVAKTAKIPANTVCARNRIRCLLEVQGE